MNSNIPDEAVEAAARAAAKDEDASNWDDENEYYRNGWRNRMQVGLEAAAPHMLADGQEAARTARDQARKLNAVISIAVRLDSSMQGADRELAEELYATMGLK